MKLYKMLEKYYVYYYVNNMQYRFEFCFESLFAAVYKARAIYDSYGYATDVVDGNTGEILAMFSIENIWVCDDCDDSIKLFTLLPDA